jgi:anaerobic magnesium-protoporphyrin IX monomethyl ester cyclase
VRVALVKPPATYADWYKRPVLGLAYICSNLWHHGFECKIFDAYFHGWSESELIGHLTRYKPDLVGVSAMTHEVHMAARIASGVRTQIGVPVVIGGCHVTALPERTMREFPAFDYGVCGEGEMTMLELLRCLQAGGHCDVRSILGLVHRDANEIVVNPPRPYLTSEELDALPWPAFDEYYAPNTSALAGEGAYYVMFTSRGCPYSCAFCMQVLGRQVRRRSPERVLAEIQHAVSRYGAHTIDFADEIFLSDSRHTREFLHRMIETGLSRQITWTGLTRANLVKPDLIDLAKQAGCKRLDMGVEAGDDEILKGINKGITVSQVRQAVKVIQQAGIPLGTYFILGHPHETKATVRKTVQLAAELNTTEIAVGLMVPYPGTRIYEMAHKGEGGYRLLSEDWSQYDKYGGRALELENLPYEYMAKWQKRALLWFYFRNWRFVDLARFIWDKRRAVYLLLKKRLLGSRGSASVTTSPSETRIEPRDNRTPSH